MPNRLYNKQVSPKGYKMGGRVKKMGGGMMKRKPMMKGSKPDFLDLDKDNNKTESMKSAAASAKKMMKGGRVKKMGGGMSKLRADTSIQKTILSKTIPSTDKIPDQVSIVRGGEKNLWHFQYLVH